MKNVPTLRFKEFNDEWEYKRLDEVAELTSSKRIYASDYVSSGIPFYRGKEITELKQGKIPSDVLYIRQEKYEEIKSKFGVPKKGELLLTAVGTLGNSFVINNSDPFYFKDGNLIWFLNIKGNPSFLDLQLSFDKGRKKVLDSAIGSTQKALTIVELNKLKFSFPGIEEQEKIVSFFSLIDKKIELQTEKVEELKNYKKGIMQKIFSQELRFKDENGNEYPEWEEKKLGEMGTCTSGVGFSDKYQGYLNLPIKVFKVSDMNIHGNHKFMVNANNTVSDELLKQMKTKSIKSPSIIFAKVGAAIFLERKRIVNSEFLIDNNMMAFIPNSSNDIEFMYYLLSGIRLSRYAQVGALPSYNASDISYIKVRIPCLKEQVKIAKVLSKIDEKIEIEQEKLNYLIQYKEGLLQQMFI